MTRQATARGESLQIYEYARPRLRAGNRRAPSAAAFRSYCRDVHQIAIEMK
jgi:hypothetical protein